MTNLDTLGRKMMQVVRLLLLASDPRITCDLAMLLLPTMIATKM